MINEFIRSPRRWLSCALISASPVLLPGGAHANTRGGSFVELAMVTHWSLPLPPQGARAQSKPGFVEPATPGVVPSQDRLELTPPSVAGQVPAWLPQSLNARAPATRQSAAKLAPVAGPALADSDLEARTFTIEDRDQPYRTPSDIKGLEVTFQLLNAADAISTVACLKREDCQENNPIYGKHPKPIVVVGAKTVVGAVHYWVMRSLLPEHPGMARAFGWFSVTVQGGVVGLNMTQLF